MPCFTEPQPNLGSLTLALTRTLSPGLGFVVCEDIGPGRRSAVDRSRENGAWLVDNDAAQLGATASTAGPFQVENNDDKANLCINFAALPWSQQLLLKIT
mmetsp:Transcript_20761/g.44318  ORF Transcript_20761/g.44318 Transcript_20761/m.44318 type:complete len:100 (+) Transcript_20761:1741-2040(+)